MAIPKTTDQNSPDWARLKGPNRSHETRESLIVSFMESHASVDSTQGA